jgi:hypothetical protein
MTLENLQKVLPVPRKPKDTGSPEAWAAVETALGFTYPADFKAYIATYGSGTIGGAINILNPISVDWSAAPSCSTLPRPLATLVETLNPFGSPREQWLYAFASTAAVCNSYQSLALPGNDTNMPIRLWPELPGLVPWAQGDAGQALLWWTDGLPANWVIVLADPTEGLLSYPMEMTSLLAGWLTSTVSLEYLSSPTKPLFSQETSS